MSSPTCTLCLNDVKNVEGEVKTSPFFFVIFNV